MHRSTIQLLRFPFSFFLMPVFWFALAFTAHIDVTNAALIFLILHLLVYPSSNGYNSYMDRDTESIGGIKNPLPPTRQLFIITIIMDTAALLLSFFVNIYFALGVLIYILASKAYSYRGIRLKKYPVAGYLTVIIFQGALIFAIVQTGVSQQEEFIFNPTGMIAAALLVGGFYPLTQVYQHQQDKKDGVHSISYMLGYKGTFIFSAMIFTSAMISIFFMTDRKISDTLTGFVFFFLPVLSYFLWWAARVFKDHTQASFENTMRMNIIASVCTNAAFIFLFIRLH